MQVLFATLSVLALGAAPALAAAGGGSSGFGGGGGGGGGSGHGGSGKAFIILWLITHPIVLGMLVLAALVFYAINSMQTTVKNARGRARRSKRVRRVELAAAEASDDDPSFAPDFVREQASSLFNERQIAWDARDRARLSELVGPDLMVEWRRRLDDFDRRGWHNRVSVLTGPVVDYVEMTNRAEDRDDRVVVRVEATLSDSVQDRFGTTIHQQGSLTDRRRLAEYWTLGKRAKDARWILLSIEQSGEGDHHLAADLVATPWDDTARLKDESLLEGAAADKLPEGVSAAEVVSVSYENDAHAAALDISLVDGRFAPDVLEVAVRRVVAAWAEAVDGSDESLAALSTPEALRDLLHPGDGSGQTRLVVRGPRVLGVKIESLDVDPEPPRMTVSVSAEGRRYIENRDTAAVVSGNQSAVTRFTAHWTLALAGDDANPWRIVDAAAEGRSIARRR